MTRQRFALMWLFAFWVAAPTFAQNFEPDEIPPYEDDAPGWVEDESGGYFVSAPLPLETVPDNPSNAKSEDPSAKFKDSTKFRFHVVNGDFWAPGKKRARR